VSTVAFDLQDFTSSISISLPLSRIQPVPHCDHDFGMAASSLRYEQPRTRLTFGQQAFS